MKPECSLGYTPEQVTILTGDREDDFWRWMRGQTMAICDGRSYNHATKEYEEACGGVAHGMPIVYASDMGRFLLGLPVID